MLDSLKQCRHHRMRVGLRLQRRLRTCTRHFRSITCSIYSGVCTPCILICILWDLSVMSLRAQVRRDDVTFARPFSIHSET
jgi:hypothetical protein